MTCMRPRPTPPVRPSLTDSTAAWQSEDLGSSQGPLGDRLAVSAAQQISERGLAAASARSIASAANASPGSINYNFGGIEQLLRHAFSVGIARAERWILAREPEVLALPRSPNGAAQALEHIVVQWTQAARPLALLYQEHLANTRSEPSPWTSLWSDFFLRVAVAFGLEEIDGRLMHLLFEAEALYNLSVWSPALEAAALRESIDHFGSFWLGGIPAPVIGAQALAEQTARGAAASEDMPQTAIRIMEAAAEVGKAGLDALTHRSVAIEAGLTTGAVTHYFRSKEQLVAAAIQGLLLTADIPMPPNRVHTAKDFVASLRANTMSTGGEDRVRQRRSLFLAAVRRSDLAASGAVIRFAHGRNTRAMLATVFDPPPEVLALQPGLLSRLLSAVPLVAGPKDSQIETHARLLAAIENRLMVGMTGRSLR